MSAIDQIIFKELSRTDFARINSAGYMGGGGQAYIDFRTSTISPAQWNAFLGPISEKTQRTHGPAWTLAINNLGTGSLQAGITIYQRRPATISIAGQKLPENSGQGNRLAAWNPGLTGFPDSGGAIDHADDVPAELIAGLRIFLIRLEDGTIWAGWHQADPPPDRPALLSPMFDEEQGLIDVSGELELDQTTPHWPFAHTALSEGPDWDEDDDHSDNAEPGITYSLQAVRNRDRAAANDVRKLYSECQISGADFLFPTKSGKPYLEVHHLIPLGKGGADSPHNMIVVSPHIHKMLHHAIVEPFDLSQVANNHLGITINGVPYTINWHPTHAAKVLQHNLP